MKFPKISNRIQTRIWIFLTGTGFCSGITGLVVSGMKPDPVAAIFLFIGAACLATSLTVALWKIFRSEPNPDNPWNPVI